MKLFLSIIVIIALFSASVNSQKLIRSGLSADERNALLSKHNELRQKVASGQQPNQPKAANMSVLNWDDSLAKEAQAWADKMQYIHSNTKYGENIATSWSTSDTKYDPSIVVQRWFNEVELPIWKTQYISSYVFGSYGHYSQVVWANTFLVGCGYVYYQEGADKKHFTVCNYRTPGNFPSVAVYKQGEPCTQCGNQKCNPKYKALCGDLK